jgi:MFS family permease
MFNTLLEMDSFLNYFHIGQAGTWAGIVTSMYQIGGVCSLPFIGPGIDNWGRRMGMTIGSVLIAAGTIIQSASSSHPSKAVGMFMCGRFFLGFGVNFVASAGPVYVVEISHPAHRGFMTGLYNCFWFVGSITATAVGRGSLQYSGNKPWEVVVWMQLFYSGLILLFVWFLPESPRWLYVHGKVDKASQMITKYHGLGKPDSVWVSMQLNEYEEYLELDGSDKRVRQCISTQSADH